MLALLLAGYASPAEAQTRLKISSITPGTERVQLVYNGDFQFQDAPAADGRLRPAAWICQGDLLASPGVNVTAADNGWVACGNVAAGTPVSMCQRLVSLEPNTAYVLSAYMWNLGDATNRVNAVIDLNDVPGEPQITLSSGDADADGGYFVYRSFNTADTGSNVTLRVFYDGFAGAGAAPKYFPIGAQWDNVGITKSADFVPPQSRAAGGNLRPVVRLDSPTDGTNLWLTAASAVLPIRATAADDDGAIVKVEFFAGTAKLGDAGGDPFSFNWTNAPSGSWVLTAVTTDNQGTTTVSAPVAITVTAPQLPVSLSIAASDANLWVSWPAPATALFLQAASNLGSTIAWKALTNEPVPIGNELLVTLPDSSQQQYFRLGPGISSSSLNRKLMMGYQGWFACPNDGSPVNRWIHWFRHQTPVATNATVDFWPDISELDNDELYATSMTLPDGSLAQLYSAFNRKTVVRHFKWMKENHLDGVFLQRFSSELGSPTFLALRNRVADNVRVGAETHGRIFAIMYDISGQAPATLVATLTNDWLYLVNNLRITNSPSYACHQGKPVVAIWGFGFTDRPGTTDDARAVIAFFKAAGVTVMGGVPTYWRTLNNDSQTSPAWTAIYRSFDIISPWAVGRYATIAEADTFRQNLIVPDLAEARLRGREYMPVIFPGFSWYNLNGGALNQIPRNGGAFYWRQVYNAVAAGCTMIYGAMFDEMDEGTAMLKMAPTSAQLPAQGKFVPLNIDGKALPSDWYLRLADEASKMLRREIPLTSQMPIQPP